MRCDNKLVYVYTYRKKTLHVRLGRFVGTQAIKHVPVKDLLRALNMQQKAPLRVDDRWVRLEELCLLHWDYTCKIGFI